MERNLSRIGFKISGVSGGAPSGKEWLLTSVTCAAAAFGLSNHQTFPSSKPGMYGTRGGFSFACLL